VQLNGLRFGISDSDVVFTGKREAAREVARVSRRRLRQLRFMSTCAQNVPSPSPQTHAATAQVRRDNAILIGAGTMIILAGLPVGAGLAWWVL
jgi:hypothetical protein